MDRESLEERWPDVLADTDATVEEYREGGWKAMGIHPGSVNPVQEAGRLDVLVPGSEFDEINARMEAIDIDAFRVYAARNGEVTFRLVAAEDTDGEIAVCVPTFLYDQDAEALRQGAAENGGLVIRLRPIDDRDVVELRLRDPDVYFDAQPGT